MRINVLGLGQSIDKYTPSGDITIGVNDIFKIIPVNNLVVIDTPEVFSKERLHTIINSTPDKFFTHLPQWRTLVPRYQKITLDKYPGCLDGLDNKELVCYSNNSTFVATVIAYKMKAKEIVLYGVDFKNHKHLSQSYILEKQLKHFHDLYLQLKHRGVKLFVCSNYSELSKIIPVL